VNSFVLEPQRGVEGIAFGMPLTAAEDYLRALPAATTVGGGGRRGYAEFDSGLTIALTFDASLRIEGVQLAGPGPGDEIRYAGLSVCDRPARLVHDTLGLRFARGSLVADGVDLVFSVMGKTLKRPKDLDGLRFDYVALCLPGEAMYLL
jgi:hypothetical protein